MVVNAESITSGEREGERITIGQMNLKFTSHRMLITIYHSHYIVVWWAHYIVQTLDYYTSARNVQNSLRNR